MKENLNFVKATLEDAQSLYEIWCEQKDVAKWMSFNPKSFNEFMPILETLMKKSEIYVVKNEEGSVMGACRLQFSSAAAELCSVGVHKDHLRKGVGTYIHEESERVAKERGCKILMWTRTGGNNPARKLDEKIGAITGAYPSDWFAPDNGPYHCIEAFMFQILDENMKEALLTQENILKQPEPCLNESVPYNFKVIESSPGQISVALVGENNSLTPIVSLQYGNLMSVIPHQVLLSDIQFNNSLDHPANQPALRHLMSYLAETKPNYKTYNVIEKNSELTNYFLKIGFFDQGLIYGGTQNEQGKLINQHVLGMCFWGIDEAHRLIQLIESSYLSSVKGSHDILSEAEQAICDLEKDQQIDKFGALYLRNIFYNIVRDMLPAPEGYDKKFFIAGKYQGWRESLAFLPETVAAHAKTLMLAIEQFSLPQQSFFAASNKFAWHHKEKPMDLPQNQGQL
ncbi:GNAT family N-acetyltransferase [Legionella israelensis]|uniref:Acetyltransferase (GNAT) family protein n=1 Tax=Legionella israelensis TaxID=454 RepID=A0A0W0VJH0_9GAMM|nr:GNAT family N-acetyltransferase [Legionella israelensis]KTD20045.1 Acetyltransferase (GNAT) family protein [Legionella israelensis]QBS11223.1 GNAT family N-acetyltransferase [Legionella israelensis]SCY58046.1 Ribosomal protein S18 acetylase RimI [Legionella israelensis DSM 19235]STX61038.1 ribosomal-protein-alanine acetyltransferase [Legionella israelensis]